MKLYKLYIKGNYYNYKRFIVALCQANALTKYSEIVTVEDYDEVSIEYICEREEIIPTLEPIKE